MKKQRRRFREKREDKAVLTEPRCPFCHSLFAPPVEISTEIGFITGGRCDCGATYVYDISGKNLGEAYMDALSYACNDDWDMAMSLEPDKDYSKVFLKYDSRAHTVIPEKEGHRFSHRAGEMAFIKLHNVLCAL